MVFLEIYLFFIVLAVIYIYMYAYKIYRLEERKKSEMDDYDEFDRAKW